MRFLLFPVLMLSGLIAMQFAAPAHAAQKQAAHAAKPAAAAPAQAQPAPINAAAINARICIIDKNKAADGQTFESCDAAPENNALLLKGFMIARVDRGTIKSRQPIWAHGICRYVDNRSPTQDVLVPFGTEEEWKTFNQFVPGIMKVAGCCVPRPITVRDVPEPTTPCIGKWVLQQVVSASSVTQATTGADQVADEKMKPGPADALLNVSGVALALPIARDDDNTSFTVDGAREFAARWSCQNDEGIAAPPAGEGSDTPAGHGDTLYVSFTVNCVHEQWTPVVLQNFCVPFESNRAYPCDAAGYPPGTPGDVIVYERTMCPKGTTMRSPVSDTCQGEKSAEPNPATQAYDPSAPAGAPPAADPAAATQAAPAQPPSDKAAAEKAAAEKAGAPPANPQDKQEKPTR